MLSESIYKAFPITHSIPNQHTTNIATNDKTILLQTNKTTLIVYFTTNIIQEQSKNYFILSSDVEIKLIDCAYEGKLLSLLYLSENILYNILFNDPLERLVHFTNKTANILTSDYKFINIWKLQQSTRTKYIAVLNDFKVISFDVKGNKEITEIKNITETVNRNWLIKGSTPFVFDYYSATLFIKLSSSILSLVYKKKENKFVTNKTKSVVIQNKIQFLNSFELSFEGRELRVKKKIKPENKCLYFRDDILAVRLIKNFIIILTTKELLYLKNSDLIKFFNGKEESEGYLWAKLDYLNDKIESLAQKIAEKDKIVKSNYVIS